MKTKFLVTVILLSTCLTSWAWFPTSITPEKLSRIHIGQTTETDLVQLFGHPTTRLADMSNSVTLDWFRSVPMPPTGYLPVVGQFLGGMNVEAQQLSVVLGPAGRVVRYEMHSSKEKARGAGVRAGAVQ